MANEAVVQPASLGKPARVQFWKWQAEAFTGWNEGGRRGIIEAVTGAGKTRIGIAAINETLKEHGRALVLVPTIELMHQWDRQLKSTIPYIRVGLLGNGMKPPSNAHVIISTVHSAKTWVSRPEFGQWLIPERSLCIADECHRYATPAYATALDSRFRYRLGLTATLARSDGGDQDLLVPYFGELSFTLGYERALRERTVAPWKVVKIGVDLSSAEMLKYDRLQRQRDISAIELEDEIGIDRTDPRFFLEVQKLSRAGDQNWVRKCAKDYLYAFSQQRTLTAASEQKLDALGKALPVLEKSIPAIIFTSTKQSAEQAARVVDRERLTRRIIHSDVPSGQRARALIDFENDDAQVLVAPRVLDEGVDVPECKVGFIIGMSSSPRQLKQRLGRIIRVRPGKRWATLFYIFARETHEDPRRSTVDEQWLDIESNAIEVRELSLIDLRLAPRSGAAF